MITKELSSIAIWSPDHIGHHFVYARLVSKLAVEKGIHVSIYGTESGLTSEEFRLHLGDLNVTRLVCVSFRSALASLPRNGLLVVCHADHVMVQLMRSRIPKGSHVVGLVMRPSRTIQRRARRVVKGAITFSLNIRRRIRISELSSLGDRPTIFIPQVPDPVVWSSPARASHEALELLGIRLPSNCVLGLVIGLLSLTKRPELLVGALELLPDEFHLMFAGHQEAEFHSVVQAANERFPGRIHVRNEHLTDEAFSLCVSAASYVAALHSTGLSSGVVLEAIAKGRPVVVIAGTRLARLVERFEIGSSALPSSESVAAAIQQVASGCLSPRPLKVPTSDEFIAALLGPI